MGEDAAAEERDTETGEADSKGSSGALSADGLCGDDEGQSDRSSGGEQLSASVRKTILFSDNSNPSCPPPPAALSEEDAEEVLII